MKAFILTLALLIGVSAMARDGALAPQKRPGQPKTSAEQFWETEEGQWLDQQFQRFQNGEITLEQSQDEYEKKFGKADLSQPSPPSLYAPVPDLKWPTR